ncbi:putative permease of the major facilitator superfamily protein [Nitrococcus mobilis Nb-231]|uniref:Putative permease of the major facilitator superfamily protein n=2 Tax=Nitrococcus mobilis TaxID=35797 RepID=A4BRJ1_9GAMM|nr:putative permease of the major facilitator superfamily protein [Nitrococcus mobilis Nb-231]
MSDPVRWRILFVLLVAIFMSLISVSIVNVALPAIHDGLGASQSDLQWVLSGYALTFGVVLVAAGRAGDIMGRGGLFLIGVGIFTAASVAAGLAPDADWLNVARFVQGIGSGLLNPQGIGKVQHYFRGDARGRAFGYFGTAIGFSVAIGPVLGGFLIQLGGPDLGWRLTFLVNVPIGVITIILGLMWFPRPLIKRLPRTGSALRSLDPVGAVLLAVAVLAILFPFVEARGNPSFWLLLPLGIVLVWLWVKWEQRYIRLGLSPMVNLKIFATRSYRNGITIMTLYFMGMTSIWVLIAIYVQEDDGKTALEAGFFGVPAALLSAYAAHWAAGRVQQFGRKLVVGGLFLALAGLGLSILVVILHEAGHISVWWLMASLSFIGVAQGTVISPNQTLTLAEVPLDYAGSSGAIMQTGQRIGTAVGIAVITAATFSALSVTSWSTAIAVGFGLISLVIMLALFVSIKDLGSRE